MGEYGFDYDTGKATYHYGDGIATDDTGKQYMETDSEHIVDLDTNEIHYAPSGSSSTHAYSYGLSLWFYIGVGSLLCCIVYTHMFFTDDIKYFLRAVGFGFFTYYCFYKEFHKEKK